MTKMTESVRNLSARLPELVWKLSAISPVINPKILPPGLFKYQFEMTPQSCADEINDDLRILNENKNARSSYYLAERVRQKINVLVQLCQRKDKQPIERSLAFGVQSIVTRQQWLGSLQEEIARLHEQREALLATLHQSHLREDPQVVLKIQSEIGEVERRLTLAQETLSRS